MTAVYEKESKYVWEWLWFIKKKVNTFENDCCLWKKKVKEIEVIPGVFHKQAFVLCVCVRASVSLSVCLSVCMCVCVCVCMHVCIKAVKKSNFFYFLYSSNLK